MDEHTMAFVTKLNDDGVEMEVSVGRFTALQCRFGGYSSSDSVQKTCIWPGDTYSWLEQCYGLKWVAVHGSKAICIVIRRSDVDMARLGPFYRGMAKDIVMYSLTAALLSEIEDLADVLRKSSDHFIVKPFGVVSVNHSRAELGHEASSADYDEKKAIAFLKEKMKSCCSEYTYEKTIETAISAFQHLCLEDLKAQDIFVCVIEDIGVPSYNLTIRETEEHLAQEHESFQNLKLFFPYKLQTETVLSPKVSDGGRKEGRKIKSQTEKGFIGKQATKMNLAIKNSGEKPDGQRSGEAIGGREKNPYEFEHIITNEDITHYGPGSSIETARKFSRMDREFYATRFWRASTLDSVDKTFIGSDGLYSWTDNSYGMMWVAVHGMDDSICVVNRQRDMDMTRVNLIKLALPRNEETYALTEAIMSEIEGLPYDGEFSKRSGQSIKKPFSVVSVIPFTEKSHDKNKAINFLKDKMKIESAITFDETVKTAISAFQHLCLQKLKAADFWVTAWRGVSLIDHLEVYEIEEHLDVINGSPDRPLARL